MLRSLAIVVGLALAAGSAAAGPPPGYYDYHDSKAAVRADFVQWHHYERSCRRGVKRACGLAAQCEVALNKNGYSLQRGRWVH